MMKLIPEANFETYLSRMNSSVDKTDIIKWIPQNSSVLDFGCASGSIAPNFDKNIYTGYDLSQEMIDAARKEHPGYHFVTNLEDNQHWDAVIFSSVLHEIYSYNDYSFEAVIEVLKNMKSHLSDNGSIYIRDGIQPVASGIIRSFELVDPEQASIILQRLRNETSQRFDVEIIGNEIVGEFQDIINFLNIYTWGEESFPREKFERVNFATHENWLEIINESGYEVVKANIISQNDYFNHLKNIVRLNDTTWNTKIFIKAM